MHKFNWQLLLVLFIACIGCSNSQKESVDKPSNQNPAAKQNRVNNIGIATFTTPNGWSANKVKKGYSVITLYRSDDDKNNPKESITIEIGSPLDPSVKTSAKVYAQSNSGKYSKLPFDVDGNTAYRVKITDSGKYGPRTCIVAHHRGKACFIVANTSSEEDLWSVHEQIVETWKWN